STLFLVGEASLNSSKVYALPVTRNGAQQVTALGAGVLQFSGNNPDSGNNDIAGVDSGLEIGPTPAGTTLFYTYFPTAFLGQRPAFPGGSETLRQVPGLLTLSGVTFSPTRLDNSVNRLNLATGTNSRIYEIPLVPGSPAGTFTFPAATTPTQIAKTSAPTVTGLQYVPGGTFAGDLLYTSAEGKMIRRIDIDPATGLPFGTALAPVE